MWPPLGVAASAPWSALQQQAPTVLWARPLPLAGPAMQVEPALVAPQLSQCLLLLAPTLWQAPALALCAPLAPLGLFQALLPAPVSAPALQQQVPTAPLARPLPLAEPAQQAAPAQAAPQPSQCWLLLALTLWQAPALALSAPLGPLRLLQALPPAPVAAPALQQQAPTAPWARPLPLAGPAPLAAAVLGAALLSL